MSESNLNEDGNINQTESQNLTNLEGVNQVQQQSYFKSDLQQRSSADNPRAKRNYMLFLREITSIDVSNNDKMKFILYYNFEDKPETETKLRNIIEVPFERNETIESIEFRLQVVYQEMEEQIVCKQKFYLYELGLTENNPQGTFSLRFKPEERQLQQFEFSLVFDASVIKTSMEGVALEGGDNFGTIQIFTANIKSKLNFEQFQQQQYDQIIEKYIQSQGQIAVRYKVILTLLKQIYTIWLDDTEIDDVFFFYSTKQSKTLSKNKQSILKIEIYQVVQETMQLDQDGDGLADDEEGMTHTQEIECTLLGDSNEEDVLDLFCQKEEMEQRAEVIFTKKVIDNFEIDFKFSLIEKSTFHKKFLGFTSVKVLETRLFTTDIEPTSAEISLLTMDNEMTNQVWKLKCFQNYVRNTDTLSVWDNKHNIIIQKNNKQASENIDVQLEPDQLKDLFKDEYKQEKILVKLHNYDQEDDFKIMLKNYTKINDYEKILQESEDRQDLNYSQIQNHNFLKTVSPFDCVQFKLFVGDEVIGYYQENFFKIPENQLILGYLIRAKDGRVRSKFLQKGETANEEEDDELEDDIIGTIKIVIDHVGYNDIILKNDNWIYDIADINTDDDTLVKIIKEGILNYTSVKQKMYVIKLGLEQIWNLVDLIVQSIKGNAFELKIRYNLFCYVVRFSIERIQLKDFKNPEILKTFKEQKRCVIDSETDENINFYCQYNKTIFKVTTLKCTIQSIMFQISSDLDYINFELKTFPDNIIITFQTQQIRQCLFLSKHGYLLIPFQIPKKIIEPKKETKYVLKKDLEDSENEEDSDENQFEKKDNFDKQQVIPNFDAHLLNSVVYFKFLYQFLEVQGDEEDDDRNDFLNQKGIYQLGIFQPTLVTKDKTQEKKLQSFMYHIVIDDRDNPTAKPVTMKYQFKANTQKYSVDYIQGAEYFRDGSSDINNKSLKVGITIKRIFSDDPDDEEGKPPVMWEKIVLVNFNKENPEILKEYFSNNQENVPIVIDIKQNSYDDFLIKFHEDNLDLDLEFYCCINYRYNRFIEIPKSEVFFAVPYEMYNTMLSDRIIEKTSSLKFKMTTRSKQALKDKKSKQSQTLYFTNAKNQGKNLKEVKLIGYHVTDTLILEIDNDQPMPETKIINFNQLIVLPLKQKEKRQESSKFIEQSYQNQGNQINEVAEGKQLENKLLDDIEDLESVYDWAFVNLNNRKLQFLIRFQKIMTQEEKDKLIQQELEGDEEKANGSIASGVTKGKSVISGKSKKLNQTGITQKSGNNNNKTQSQISQNNGESKKEKVVPQVILLKEKIKEREQQVQNYITSINKLKKKIVQYNFSLEQLQKIIQRGQLQSVMKKNKDLDKSSQQPKKPQKKQKELSEQALKAQELFRKQCVCKGDQEPAQEGQNKKSYLPIPGGYGFCAQCIQQIQEEYKKELQNYRQEADKYEEDYLANFNKQLKIVKMQKKIEQIQKKSAGLDVDEEDMEAKMKQDEIDYVKKNIKVIDSEIELHQKDHLRQVKQKQLLQQDIEKSIVKKDQKTIILEEEIAERKIEIEKLNIKIKQLSENLTKIKDQKLFQ